MVGFRSHGHGGEDAQLGEGEGEGPERRPRLPDLRQPSGGGRALTVYTVGVTVQQHEAVMGTAPVSASGGIYSFLQGAHIQAMNEIEARSQSAESVPPTFAPIAVAELLWDVVRPRVGPGGREWLERAVAEIRPPLDRGAFAVAFTVCARRVGMAPLTPSTEELARLRESGMTWPLTSWGMDELTRSALLLRAAAALSPREFKTLVEESYHHGDNRERQAVLRALALLPAPDQFLPLAIEACRTSIQPLFEAIACENPYPAAHFPELNFNQMVLKALFTGVPLRRIVGLEGRITAELRRMAADYASERRAAARSIPPDIAHLLNEKGNPS